jgi:hypothetical protein
VLPQGFGLEIDMRVFDLIDDFLTEEGLTFKDMQVFFELFFLYETEPEFLWERIETMGEEFSRLVNHSLLIFMNL